MPISKPALAGAVAAALLAATAVADQPVGLALSTMVVVMVATGVVAAPAREGRRVSRGFAALAVALGAQPLLWDASWVVAVDVVAALVAGAAAVVPVGRWAGVRRALLAPWRLVGGGVLVARAGVALGRLAARGGVAAGVLRGGVLAGVLVAVFAVLFTTADSAFAQVVHVDVRVRTDTLVWRGTLALAVLAGAGALARAAVAPVSMSEAERSLRWRPGRTELLIPLVAVVALFALFVAVQLRVLFGGAGYVRATTGLGYGEYARHGFVELLLVASLTLGVIAAAAARSRDRAVRALLGMVSVLTLVVLVSAQHRLDLVEDAYGATRVRYAGHAVVLGIAGAFALVLAAGLSRRVARHLPAIALALLLVGALTFSLSDPDRRIAQTAVDRARAGQAIDITYLSSLSADALPALKHLPPGIARARVLDAIHGRRLRRADGVAGFNLSRAAAR